MKFNEVQVRNDTKFRLEEKLYLNVKHTIFPLQMGVMVILCVIAEVKCLFL